MTNAPVFSGIDYGRRSLFDTTALTPVYDTHFKGLKKWLGIALGAAVSIAIPFAAPAIGGLLGGGFFASVIGQSLIGAGLGALGGAASSAITGGNILQGALIGGAGGALAGGAGAYMSGAGFTTDAATAAQQAAMSGAAPAGLTSTGIEGAQLAGTTAAGAATGAGTSLTSGVTGRLLDVAMTQGPKIAASMLTDTSAMDQALKDVQAEMEAYKGINDAAYQQRLELYNELVNQAKNINPAYYSALAVAQAQQQTASEIDRYRREAATMGGAGAQQRSGEARRLGVLGAAEAATASVRGDLEARGQQAAGLRGAAGAYPTYDTGYLNSLSNMASYQKQLADQQAKDKAAFAGGLGAAGLYALTGNKPTDLDYMNKQSAQV